MSNDDIVTRQETQIDFVEYLRLWASPDGNNQAVKDLHKAADEIERLRINRDRWRKTAEQLARELGKVEYAQATYEDVVRDGKYDALMSTTDWEDYER